MDEFVPAVTFADADDARDAYFAVEAMCRAVAYDLGRAARDDSVTVHQMNAVADKYARLSRLANQLHAEWERDRG